MTPKRMACGARRRLSRQQRSAAHAALGSVQRRRPAGPHPGRAARGPQQRRFSPSPQPLPPGAEYRWQARPGSALLTRGARPAPPPSRSQDADAPPPPPPPALPVTASHRRPCPARPAPLWCRSLAPRFPLCCPPLPAPLSDCSDVESRRCPRGAGMESGDAQEDDITSAAPNKPGPPGMGGCGHSSM
ncbi:sulfated surface glycoprotein 185-like isoform X1 [Gallus gallus]|uniref:sulfated surface glycoprotein 185-like isoform X1 n=1 Tax=Gallus gallus TaxID=9031 RepID=UPI001F026CFD|nr:sulfated surface glycoprotein 185-like isoform X1 [Gallus gallus]